MSILSNPGTFRQHLNQDLQSLRENKIIISSTMNMLFNSEKAFSQLDDISSMRLRLSDENIYWLSFKYLKNHNLYKIKYFNIKGLNRYYY